MADVFEVARVLAGLRQSLAGSGMAGRVRNRYNSLRPHWALVPEDGGAITLEWIKANRFEALSRIRPDRPVISRPVPAELALVSTAWRF